MEYEVQRPLLSYRLPTDSSPRAAAHDNWKYSFLFAQIVAVFPPEGRNICIRLNRFIMQDIRDRLDALMDKGEGAEVEFKSAGGGPRKPEAEWTRS